MHESPRQKPLFTGQLLLRNTTLSFLGQALPIAIALISIPRLIHRLGDERFGVLMLAWMFLGYFNLFDFGLSRALTKRIAEQLEGRAEGDIPALFWTVCLSTALFGICGAGLMALLSKWLITHVLKVPANLELETLHSFYVIAIALPFVLTTSCFKGVLEATQNFRAINRLQVPLGVVFYLSPWIFSIFTIQLPVVISALVLSRIVGWFFYLRLGFQNLPGTKKMALNYSLLPSLMKFGGWVTVANIPMPMIGYADRFMIGMLMSMAAVTYYSTPYEVINRVAVIPAAVLSVIFPAFAAQLVSDRERASLTFRRANKLILITVLPASLTALCFAREALTLWAGETLAVHSYPTLQILSLAIFFNCFGVIPSALLDALGRPSITAISHLLQLPIYIAALAFFVPIFGIEGAAVIWVFRNAIDSAILYFFAARSFPGARLHSRAVLATVVPPTLLMILIVGTDLSLAVRFVLYMAAVAAFLPTVWLRVLNAGDRLWVTRTLLSKFQVRRTLKLETRKHYRRIGIALAAYRPDLTIFREQLLSISGQSNREWFCVVSLDSEIDRDDPRIREFVLDPRFVWIRNLVAPGVIKNFENALKEVINQKADAVAFSDQDDVWYPTKLDRLKSELEQCGPLSLVHSDMHLFTVDTELGNRHLPLAWAIESRVLEGYEPLHFILRNTVTGASSMFDAELARVGLPIPASSDYHDHWFAILASIFGEVRPVYEPLYAYRQHSANVVGASPFPGIFYKPGNVTWIEGWRKAGKAWNRRRGLFEYLASIEGVSERLPSAYRKIFLNRAFSCLFFLASWILFVNDDPSLARIFLNNGMGSLRSPKT